MKLLRNVKFHCVSIVCLSWEEDRKKFTEGNHNILTYEDMTTQFFPHAPRSPRIPGLVPGDSGFMDESEDSFPELFILHINNLASYAVYKDGDICFSMFGIFPVGEVNIQNITL